MVLEPKGVTFHLMGQIAKIWVIWCTYIILPCMLCLFFSNLRHAQKVEVTLLSPFHVRQMVESQDKGFYGEIAVSRIKKNIQKPLLNIGCP